MDKMQSVTMDAFEVKRKCRAIVMFGPATHVSGMRGGAYFQVTLDPATVSPGGQYIRLGLNEGDEINGWQRIDCLTVCEILGEYGEEGSYPDANNKDEPLVLMKIS